MNYDELEVQVARELYVARMLKLHEYEDADGERHVNPRREAETAAHCASVFVSTLRIEREREERFERGQRLKTKT